MSLYDITTSESQSFDWTGLHQHHTLHTHCHFIFTIAQDNIPTNNEVELLINYWALLCAVSWQQIHTSASFHTLYSGLYMLVSHSRPTSSTMSEGAGTQHTLLLWHMHQNMVASEYAVTMENIMIIYVCVNYHLCTVQVAYWSPWRSIHAKGLKTVPGAYLPGHALQSMFAVSVPEITILM